MLSNTQIKADPNDNLNEILIKSNVNFSISYFIFGFSKLHFFFFAEELEQADEDNDKKINHDPPSKIMSTTHLKIILHLSHSIFLKQFIS